jgi:probable F420-dependent oxidoreductase
MRVGVHVPVFGPLANADNILAVARRAEALGFDSVWSSDHVIMPARVESRYPYSATGQFLVPPDSTWFDPLIALAAVASVTARVRLGTSVVIVPYRNPIVLAKMVSSLDCLCHGRLILGCGAGWLKEEFDALGVPHRERGGRMDEALDIMRILWRDGAGTFNGRFYRFTDMHLNPKPVQRPGPPCWIGGSSDAALRRVLRRGDGWHPTRVTPEGFRARLAVLRDMAAREGRDLGLQGPRDLHGLQAGRGHGHPDRLPDRQARRPVSGPGRDGPRYFAPGPGMRAAASLSQMTNAGCASRLVKLIGTSTFTGIWSLDIGHSLRG